MISLTILGLVLIIFGWFVQLKHVLKGNENLQKNLLILYSLGAFILAINSFKPGTKLIALFNLIAAIFTFLIVYKLKGKNKQ